MGSHAPWFTFEEDAIIEGGVRAGDVDQRIMQDLDLRGFRRSIDAIARRRRALIRLLRLRRPLAKERIKAIPIKAVRALAGDIEHVPPPDQDAKFRAAMLRAGHKPHTSTEFTTSFPRTVRVPGFVYSRSSLSDL